MQISRFSNKRKGIATACLAASKRGCLSAREVAQQQWDEELAARLQDKEEDVTMAENCELITTFLEDTTPEDEFDNIVDDTVDFGIMDIESINEDRDEYSIIASTSLQDFTIDDGTIAPATSRVWGEPRRLERAVAHHLSHCHPPLEDQTVQTSLAEVEVMVVDAYILCHLGHKLP